MSLPNETGFSTLKVIKYISFFAGGVCIGKYGKIMLKRIPDSFTKIVVVRDYLKPVRDEAGILYMGIEQFLLDEDVLK